MGYRRLRRREAGPACQQALRQRFQELGREVNRKLVPREIDPDQAGQHAIGCRHHQAHVPLRHHEAKRLRTIPVRANTAAVAPSRRAISGIRHAVALACAARSRCIGTMTSTAPAAGSNATRQRGRLTSAILLLTNLVPLAGVLWWGWDAFVLLCLYWLETAVIGFWTILRVAILSQANGSPGGRSIAAALALGGFFTVHAGLFMAVHMAFLWLLFAGPWAAKIHDARDFIRLIVIGMDLWIPLAALFAGRGAVFVDDAVNRFAFGKASEFDRRAELEPDGAWPSIDKGLGSGVAMRAADGGDPWRSRRRDITGVDRLRRPAK